MPTDVQVWKGAEDGRLLRLLVRLSSVLERPESETDPQWAETGLPHSALQQCTGGEYSGRAYIHGGEIHVAAEANMKSRCALMCTGDRYLLKLFRDVVLHQVREDGSPLLDWGHVVECLNKLDAGVPEKVLLLFLCLVALCHLKPCKNCNTGTVGNPKGLIKA